MTPWIFAGCCWAAAIVASQLNPDYFLRRMAAVKRRDRTVPDPVFAGVALVLVAAEAWTLRRAGVDWSSAAPLLVLTAYVPMTFLFYCNLINVGTQRELSWMLAFLGICAASWALFDSLRLTFILPPAVALTLLFCRLAWRDPYSQYRRATRLLDEKNDPVGAEKGLRRAVDLRPGEARYLYHLARALNRLGRSEEADALFRRAFEIRPGLLDDFRADPLFRSEWLTKARR